ncbi:O-antigen ligase family protein [Oceanobacillus rekensis]|uniref:O-antigen ligase family protein n=1 Tax=Oceanobacillus rekensis TaxID=937927 RepID=UPI0011209414|nr:O-antigen ligase family protein [Oceanobacillus rekensis]
MENEEEKMIASNNLSLVNYRIFSFLLITACLLSPFYTLRIGNILFTISDFLFLLTIFYLFIIKGFYFNKQVLLYYSPLFFGVFLIVFGHSVSVIINGFSDDLITEPLQYLFVYLLLPFILISANEDTILRSIKAYVWGISLVILIGAILLLFLPDVYKTLESHGIFIGISRMGSFLGANGLAKTVALSIPLLFLIRKIGLIKKITFYFFSIIFLIGILLSSSYGGSIAAIISLIVTFSLNFLISKKKNIILDLLKYFIYLLLFIVVFSFFLYLDNKLEWNLTSGFQERIINVLVSQEVNEAGSYLIKLDLMRDAIEIISQNPIIGMGPGNYLEQSIYSQNVHNAYLGLWVESGLFSIVGLLIILLTSIFYSLISLSSKTRKLRIYGMTAFVVTLILCINLFTDTTVYVRSTILPMLVLFSLVVKSLYIERKNIRMTNKQI